MVNIGSPLVVGMNPEFVDQTMAVHNPRRIETNRIAYNFVRVESSFGRSSSTMILFFFFRFAISFTPSHILFLAARVHQDRIGDVNHWDEAKHDAVEHAL